MPGSPWGCVQRVGTIRSVVPQTSLLLLPLGSAPGVLADAPRFDNWCAVGRCSESPRTDLHVRLSRYTNRMCANLSIGKFPNFDISLRLVRWAGTATRLSPAWPAGRSPKSASGFCPPFAHPCGRPPAGVECPSALNGGLDFGSPAGTPLRGTPHGLCIDAGQDCPASPQEQGKSSWPDRTARYNVRIRYEGRHSGSRGAGAVSFMRDWGGRRGDPRAGILHRQRALLREESI